MPDGNNRLGGSFYAGAPVTGDWDTFISRDLVRFVDSVFRTDPGRRARALAGHSMGGFGALTLGFRHPETFGLVYAMSPCCADFRSLPAPTDSMWRALARLERWRDAVGSGPPLVLAMAAAIGGEPTSPPLFRELPYRPDRRGGMVPVAGVVRRWQARMPPALARALARSGRRSPAIYLEAGDEDARVLPGYHAMAAELRRLGIRPAVTTFAGGHVDRMAERVTAHLLPIAGAWFRAAPD